MRFHRLDLNLLIYLDALLTERSVSKAAHRVHISQSAMSDALARLREYFEDRLFLQVGRSMTPTPLALSMLQPVRDILLQVESVASSKAQFDPLTSRRKITILASDYVTDVLLERVFAKAAKVAPGMSFEIKPFVGGFVEEFQRGDLDFLITPRGYASAEHPFDSLYKEAFTCVVWTGNTRIRTRLTPEAYETSGHISINLGDWRVSTYDEWYLKHRGSARKIELTVPSFRMGLQFVRGSGRILTCHRRHARLYADHYDLRLVRPPFEIPAIELVLQWHRYKEQDPALAWFRRLVRDSANQL